MKWKWCYCFGNAEIDDVWNLLTLLIIIVPAIEITIRTIAVHMAANAAGVELMIVIESGDRW